MTLLSDKSIRRRMALPEGHPRRLLLDGVDLARDVQPCSVDVYLGLGLKVYTGSVMDTRRDNRPWWKELAPDVAEDGSKVYVLRRGEFYLGVLANRLVLPRDVAATLTGNSTAARHGIIYHQQAGHVDPGYDGWLTLEITVGGADTTILVPGTRAGQLKFELLDQDCERPYRGRYQHDIEPQPARLPARVAA